MLACRCALHWSECVNERGNAFSGSAFTCASGAEENDPPAEYWDIPVNCQCEKQDRQFQQITQALGSARSAREEIESPVSPQSGGYLLDRVPVIRPVKPTRSAGLSNGHREKFGVAQSAL